jgi:hypothetical protein
VTFAEAVQEVIRDASARPERPTPGSLCERIARETERYIDRVQFSSDRYLRHPILLWDDWEVMLIAWESGQITPIHDHRGVMGAWPRPFARREGFTTPENRPAFDNRARPEAPLRPPAVLHRLTPSSGRDLAPHSCRPPLRTWGSGTPTG